MQAKERKITYHASPLWAGLAALALILTIGVTYYYFSAKSSNESRIRSLTSSNSSMLATNTKLSADYSDARAEKVRKESDAIRTSMMTDADADAFVASLRPTWSVLSRTDEDSGEFLRRRIQIARGSAPVSIWTDVEELIGRIQGINSMAMGAIEIQTVGDNRKREFSRISFTLIIYVRKIITVPAAGGAKS